MDKLDTKLNILETLNCLEIRLLQKLPLRWPNFLSTMYSTVIRNWEFHLEIAWLNKTYFAMSTLQMLKITSVITKAPKITKDHKKLAMLLLLNNVQTFIEINMLTIFFLFAFTIDKKYQSF